METKEMVKVAMNASVMSSLIFFFFTKLYMLLVEKLGNASRQRKRLSLIPLLQGNL